jgi:hypothetical protein
VKPSGETRQKRTREDVNLGDGDSKKVKHLEFSETMLDEFEKTGFFKSTQVTMEEGYVFRESVLDQTIVRAKPNNIEEAMGNFGELDNKVKML